MINNTVKAINELKTFREKIKDEKVKKEATDFINILKR